jgi:four helix bundle protein
MTRAAISIPSNIAEGFERGSRKQQIESCYLAKGSAGELRTQLILAHDLNLLDKTAFDWLLEKCDHCSRQLAVYLRHLKQSSQRIRGARFVADERCQRISAPGTGIGATSVNAVPTSPPPHVPTQE